ncbi:hypothetical protein GCM10027344_26440 [Spelaeicoccus albus]
MRARRPGRAIGESHGFLVQFTAAGKRGFRPQTEGAAQTEGATQTEGAGHTTRVPRACAPEYPHSRGRTVVGGVNAADKSG